MKNRKAHSIHTKYCIVDDFYSPVRFPRITFYIFSTICKIHTNTNALNNVEIR